MFVSSLLIGRTRPTLPVAPGCPLRWERVAGGRRRPGAQRGAPPVCPSPPAADIGQKVFRQKTRGNFIQVLHPRWVGKPPASCPDRAGGKVGGKAAVTVGRDVRPVPGRPEAPATTGRIDVSARHCGAGRAPAPTAPPRPRTLPPR